MSEIVTRADCVTAAMAANRRWPMSDEQRSSTIERLLAIVSDPSSSSRLVISASKALASFDKINLDSQPKQTHSVNLNLNVDDRKIELAKRLESLTDGIPDDADEE